MINPATRPPADWAVLVYQDTDSSLRPYLEENLKAVAACAPTDRVVIAAQSGTEPGAAKRFEGGREVATVAGPMRSPGTLSDFLAWGMRAYPARHTMLIVAGHGEGWRGVCSDGKGGRGIPLSALRDALQSAPRRVDVVGFDACQMGQAEALAALGNSTPLVIASEELIGPPGWPYAAILDDLKAHPDRTPREEATAVVDASKADELARQEAETTESVYTLAAYDTSHTEAMLRDADALAAAVVDAQVPPAVLRGAMHCTQGFNRGIPHPPDSEFRDLVGFAIQLATDESIDDPRVNEAARRLLKTAEKLIVTEHHAGREERHAFGLSAYLPLDYAGDAAYETSPLGTTRWAEMLRYAARS